MARECQILAPEGDFYLDYLFACCVEMELCQRPAATSVVHVNVFCWIFVSDFILDLLSKPELREKYQKFAFRDHVDSHPHLRCCPGNSRLGMICG